MDETATQWTLSHPPGLLGASLGDLTCVEPGDIVMVGYFCDNLGGGPAGARFLARQIRYFSETDAAPGGVHDLGDLNVFPLEPRKHASAIDKQLEMIARVGGVPLMVGGDRSGINIFAQHIARRIGRAPVIREPGRLSVDGDATLPTLLAIDLSDGLCAGLNRVGRNCRMAELADRIKVLPGRPLGGAIFGMAPKLDWSGAAETRLAHDLLVALVRRMRKVHVDAAA